ncbi:XRE family transcriptional regulator [Yoonia sp.]|uniref:helix-turn-helix domain-containing protein n=1 Tax=Yoonia sp. TaxID=2212373 RepID=UPI0019EAED9C|nr:XRE family transcriptional regulator [Yoonia sp.]MBE0412290.1 helix-turn-helix transcriptional regulator [Yoonia sp.]
MLHDLPKEARTLGADVRALRKARALTLQDLAQPLGRSVGWLSQVERGISEPSQDDLCDLARALDVSVSSLIQRNATPRENGRIVRANARRPIGSRTPGLVEGLLSPDLTDDFEVIHSSFAPGATLDTALTRPTQEIGYIVAGRFDLWVDGDLFQLGKGDSFRLRGEPFRWANPYHETCDIIWVISPPIY